LEQQKEKKHINVVIKHLLWKTPEPVFVMFKEPRNRFQRIDFARPGIDSLDSLKGLQIRALKKRV
jgi:hypothetical protein